MGNKGGSSAQNESASRDLRPAVFIKDLKKRALILEEEKAEHHRSLKKKAASKATPASDREAPKKDGQLEVYRKSLEEGIASKDPSKLKEAIYQAKMVSLETECSQESFAKLQSMI